MSSFNLHMVDSQGTCFPQYCPLCLPYFHHLSLQYALLLVSVDYDLLVLALIHSAPLQSSAGPLVQLFL